MPSVLITGTSTGLGLETALTLGRAGHNVYATMRNPSRAPELGRRALQEGLPIRIVVMDVDSDNSVKTAIADIYKGAGSIDVLVNNAGLVREGSVEELPLAEFRAVMETNYFGAIRCIQAVVPAMRQSRNGCIINISSVAGRVATSPMAPYTASKFALEALSEALAQEMKTFNVRVAIVEPGIIDPHGAIAGGAPKRIRLYPATTFRPHVCRLPQAPGTALAGGRESLAHHRKRDLATASPGGARRRTHNRLAYGDERRGIRRHERGRRRHLVRANGA